MHPTTTVFRQSLCSPWYIRQPPPIMGSMICPHWEPLSDSCEKPKVPLTTICISPYTDCLCTDKKSFIFRVLCYFLSPRSLSDLCLKVYFSSDYSNAEFIIVNATLNCEHVDFSTTELSGRMTLRLTMSTINWSSCVKRTWRWRFQSLLSMWNLATKWFWLLF